MQSKVYRLIRSGFIPDKNTDGILLNPTFLIRVNREVAIEFVLNAVTKEGKSEGHIGYVITYAPSKPNTLAHPDIKDALNTAIKKCNQIFLQEYNGLAQYPILSDSQVLEIMRSITKA